MMKRLVVLVLCALVVGCGGGGGKMAASDPVEVARRIADALEARRIAVGLPGGLKRTEAPFEGHYEIERGVLTDPTPGILTDNPVKHTDGIITISDDWTGARYTRDLTITQDFVDTFVIYTNSESASDTDYVDFGYWRREGAGTADGISITSFISGPLLSTSEDMQLVEEGSATYSGPATGLYVYAEKSGDNYTKSGQFKAETMLTVKFGVENPDDDKEFLVTISGEVFDFTDSNGAEIDPNWTVDLQKAQHSPFQHDTGEFDSGMTTGGGPENGEWIYYYFGQLDGTATARPAIVGGAFNSTFSNGGVSGAFAATFVPP